MLRSGANIFVYQILVQGRCVWDLPIIIKFIHYFKKIHSFLNIVQYCVYWCLDIDVFYNICADIYLISINIFFGVKNLKINYFFWTNELSERLDIWVCVALLCRYSDVYIISQWYGWRGAWWHQCVLPLNLPATNPWPFSWGLDWALVTSVNVSWYTNTLSKLYWYLHISSGSSGHGKCCC